VTRLPWLVYWILAALGMANAYALGGIPAATIELAVTIGLWGLIDGRAGLWMSVAFMVFLFVFFPEAQPTGDVLPEEFYYWGVGLAIIALGLSASVLASRGVDWSLLRSRLRTAPSLATMLLLAVFVLAALYGKLVGNETFAVARQVFGCLLLPVFYVLALAFLRTPADVDQWLRRVSWAVALGALWSIHMLLFASLAQGEYYREQSGLSGYAGTIAAVSLNEFRGAQSLGGRLRSGILSLLCLLVIVWMGHRAALGSLAVAVVFVWAGSIRKRGVSILTLAAGLLFVVAAGPSLVERLQAIPGIPGQLAGRFLSPLDEDRSYLGRLEQWGVVVSRVGARPLLGDGMGSEFEFVIPDLEQVVRANFVDNGWGYLLLKTGLVGLSAFLVVLFTIFRAALARLNFASTEPLAKNSVSLLAVFLYCVVGLLGGPTFFHFSGSGFVGIVLGSIVVLAEARQAAWNQRSPSGPERIHARA
jgi:hypothetical protein